jgi:predicted Zn finger-like uncharacterized protein
MNIACTACPARYGVADDKIMGKRVRITCKRCATVLVIDGTVSPPTVTASTSIAPGPPSGRAPAPEPAPPPASPPEPFLVAFADGHQERADVAQIVRLHRAGQLGPDSVVWRDGMADWKNPWDVEEIAQAFRRMGYTRPTPLPSPEVPLAESGDDEATRVAPSSPDAASAYGGDESADFADSPRQNFREPASSPVQEDDEMPTHVARSPLARVATRADARRSERPARQSARPLAQNQARAEPARRRDAARPSASPTADRFARQAYAGSEEDEFARQRATSDSQQLMDASEEGQRLTGARNETSVLFSLDSLIKQEQAAKPARQRPARIDEALLVDTGPSLPGGGGFAPALAAPDFTAPISAPPPPPLQTAEPVYYPRADNSRKWMMLTAVVVLMSGVGFAWMSGSLRGLGLGPAPAVPLPPVPSVPVASAVPTSAPTQSATAEPSASAAASASAPAASAPSAPAAPRAPMAASPTPRPQVASPSPAQARPAPQATAEETEAAAPTPAPAPAPAGGGGDFDAAAAKTALTAAAGNASSCKEPGGATGNGRVSITFAPSGRPTSVAVTGDLAGTTVGSCVARLFRQTRVPAFSGDPVTVAKGFTVQ